MLASAIPDKIQLPFANSGTKNTIPVPSQIGVIPGAASFSDGFPPLTFTPIASGGIPPDGADLNGVLNSITKIQQWQSAGGIFKYDSAFSTAIGGYPKGSILQSSTGDIAWLSLVDNNTTDPDAVSAAGWASLAAYGIGAVTGLTNVNHTLTPAQYAMNVITLAGTLTGNVQIIFPDLKQKWMVVNNTTGDFTVTCKTAAGTGDYVPHFGMQEFYGDGTNLVPSIGDQRYGGSMPSVSASVAANALTFTLKAPHKFDFRNPSLSSGTPDRIAIGSDLTITVPSGATLGLAAGIKTRLVFAIAYNGGAPVLCVGNNQGALDFSETNLISPTTISAAADSANVIYSESAVSANSPYIVVAVADITLVTPGTWDAAPSLVNPSFGNGENAALFPFSFGTNGWTKLPNGLIVQWGSANTSAGSVTINFPIQFPNAFMNGFACGAATNAVVNFDSGTTTQATIYSRLGYTGEAISTGVRYFAIGY